MPDLKSSPAPDTGRRRTWIGNGRLVQPGRIIENGSLLMEDGRVAALNLPCPEGVTAVDARGGYILPGFIDLHVHGGGGGDFMDADPESCRRAVRAHCAHGTTAMVATTMTSSDELLEEVIDCFLKVQNEPTGGAELLGLHLEGPYFSAKSKGAQPVSEQRIPTREALEKIIRRGKGQILRWDAAPELDGMELFAQVMRENGILCAAAHTAANATRMTEAFDWGFSHITHFYNAITTYHKENRFPHGGVVEATYIRDDVTIELISDGCHIPRESFLLAYRVKGPDRIALITDAMRAAGTDEKYSMLGPRVGGVPVVIQDDVAQMADLSCFAGSICTMDRALRTAHLKYGLPLVEVSRMLSMTPARLSGVAHRKGSLEMGKDADVVLMDPDFRVQKVWVRGELFRED